MGASCSHHSGGEGWLVLSRRQAADENSLACPADARVPCARHPAALLAPFSRYSEPFKAPEHRRQVTTQADRAATRAAAPVMAPASDTNMADTVVRGANVSTSTRSGSETAEESGAALADWPVGGACRAGRAVAANQKGERRNWPLRLFPRHAGSLED